jgi:hypothetical protein
MDQSFLEIPEAANMTIASLRVFNDPPCSEVQIRFTDGTEISIDLDFKTVIRGRHYRSDRGDFEIFQEYGDKSST